MNSFSQFNIKPTTKGFEGDKIKMSKILNREIVIHDHKIDESKCFRERGSGKCLQLQITLNSEKHVVFTGSSYLIAQIQQIAANDFPFSATIVKDNERFMFT